MKHAFLISGPNASGKTTTVQRALESYRDDPRVAVIYADNGSKYKGSNVTANLREVWMSDAPVVVIEGTHRITLVVERLRGMDQEVKDSRTLHVHITRMNGDVLISHLRQRCEKLGKAFRSDYWVEPTATYEGRRRLAAIAQRSFRDARFWMVSEDYSECDVLAETLKKEVAACL